MRKIRKYIGLPELVLFTLVVLLVLSITILSAIVKPGRTVISDRSYTDETGKVYTYPTQYAEYVRKAASDYGVEEERIYAVIKVESDFDPRSTSSVMARGLMQMIPSTYRSACEHFDMEEKDPEILYDPGYNIDICTHYLRYLYDKCGENWDNAHVAYNTGSTFVLSLLKDDEYSKDGKVIAVPEGSSGMKYLDRINYYYEIYKKCR